MTCPGIAIDDAALRITHVDAVAGNEKVLFKGTLPFPAGAPSTFAPASTGAQVLIREAGIPSALFALTSEDGDPIPPGAPGAGCGPKDGWVGVRYMNRSGFIDPPACERSAQGLRFVKLRDKRSKGKGILFTVKTVRSPVTDRAPEGSIEATVALGATDAALLDGACGVAIFPPTDCALAGRSYRCRVGTSPRRR